MELTIIAGTWLFPYKKTHITEDEEMFNETYWINLFDIEQIRLTKNSTNQNLAVIKLKDNGLPVYLLDKDYHRLIKELELIRAKQLDTSMLVIDY